MFSLRKYQRDIISQVFETFAIGDLRNSPWSPKNVCLQLSTGAGKTVIFCKIIEELKVPTIIIAHRKEILSQISLTLARYGIRHDVIGAKGLPGEIVKLHMQEMKRSFYDMFSDVKIASVDTLIKYDPETDWIKNIQLVVQDEAHHVLRKNKWGKVAALFPSACGLYPTATPVRSDGHGLGREAQGVIDELIVGPSLRELIDQGYMCAYRLFGPPCAIDLSQIPIGVDGDYSLPRLRTMMEKSRIVGDVVAHYKRLALGKSGVTFAVSIKSAVEIAKKYNAAGVSAKVISAKTLPLERYKILQDFKDKKILQLVNVDILGEGIDVPAIEVVSLARPTKSYALYMQQIGRAFRPFEGKPYAIVIDHVGNIHRHGLPDVPQRWTLGSRTKRSNSENIILIKNCFNPECFAVYERYHKECPYCGFRKEPEARDAPHEVEGDLTELKTEVLKNLYQKILDLDIMPRTHPKMKPIVRNSILKHHRIRKETSVKVREAVSRWAGIKKHKQKFTESEMLREFYFLFGVDILTAQTLGKKEMLKIIDDINLEITALKKIFYSA